MKISLTELLEIIAMQANVVQLTAQRDALKQEVLDLVAGDAATAAKVQAAFDKSEAVEAKMRGAVAGR